MNYQANGTNGMFIPNTNCWTYGIDTSCASMWNSHQGRFRAGTLISPRHMIFAHHFAIGPGQHMVFLGTDLNVYTNTIASTRRIMGTDVLIASLQSEVDTAVIRPAKILPPNFQDYIGPGRHLPVLRFDQDERCIVCEISRNVPFLATSPNEAEESIMTSRPLSDFLQTFHAPTRDLDSGNPCFMLVEDQVVLLGTLHWRWNGTGGDSSSSVPFVTHYATEIQAAMDELAPGYALDFLDVAHYLPMQQGAL